MSDKKYPKAILLTIAVFALVHIVIAIIPGRVMNAIYVVMAWAFVVGTLLVVHGTLVQNGWGNQLKPCHLPVLQSHIAEGA